MKYKSIFVCTIILTAALVLAACPQPTGSGLSNGNLGETLRLSGQVYRMGDMNTLDPQFPQFIESTDINSPVSSNISNGAGNITGGKLQFTVKKPTDDELFAVNPDIFLAKGFDNVNITNESARYTSLVMTTGNGSLSKMDGASKLTTFPTLQMKIKVAIYLYTDRDVTITGKGKKEIPTADIEEILFMLGTNFPSGLDLKLTTTDLNLRLTKGWNAILASVESDIGSNFEDGSINPFGAIKSVVSYSVANPAALKWVILESEVVED